MAILAISTNTRLLGLAIITEKGLQDYSIRLHKSSWSPSKANTIIISLEPCVRQYSIKTVVLSIPYVHHQTEAFKVLTSHLRAYFEAKGIIVHEVSTEAIYALCPADEKKTKKELMNAICKEYPQLSICRLKEVRNRHKYYIKVFEAVGATMVHLRE